MKQAFLVVAVVLALAVAGCGGGGSGSGSSGGSNVAACNELAADFYSGDTAAKMERWTELGCEELEQAGQLNSSSGAAEVSAATAEGWAGKWCQVQLGDTLAVADDIMGTPTYASAEQHQWEAFEWHFTAFANSDGTIRQMDSTEDGSTPETSSVDCGEPVLGVPEAKTRQ